MAPDAAQLAARDEQPPPSPPKQFYLAIATHGAMDALRTDTDAIRWIWADRASGGQGRVWLVQLAGGSTQEMRILETKPRLVPKD